jgi:hypothetical protein
MKMDMMLDEVFEPMTAPNSSNTDPELVAKLIELLPQRPGQGVWLSKLGFQPSETDSPHLRDSYRKAVVNGLGVPKERVITSTRRVDGRVTDVQLGLTALETPSF